MRTGILVFISVLTAGAAVPARPQPNPRQQPGALVHIYAPEQHDLANKKLPAGETNPATQQIDFYIRSPQQNPKNRPNRQVFVHFFGMEITWK
ncbi:MAG: hypothetical protein HY654_03765 [Acidobacteria bacterium]|nr:hypothetical protein [Acidobacteriota bacterium]